MIGDSQWIEGLLYKAMARARELINQQAQSFRDSLERWLALNWPILMVPGWEVRFNNFLRDWRANGVILQPESAQQLFDYLDAQSERMRAEGVQLPEQLPTLQSLLPTREQAMRPADERHFPDDLPAPFDPAYPQLRRTGNSIMQRYPPEDWLRRAEQVLKNYRVPEEIAKQFLAWIAAEQQKRTAPAVQSAAALESFGPADLHPLAVCFAAGTPVITRRGPIAIEQVVDGDEVPAVPETDPLAPIRWCRVERAYHNNPAELINIHVSGLPMIRATLNHPFFVWGKGFIAARRLGTGDLLRTADDRWLPVSETFRDGAIRPVYNLCVAECHTYFAGGILVHNDSESTVELAQARADDGGPSAPGPQAEPVQIDVYPDRFGKWEKRNQAMSQLPAFSVVGPVDEAFVKGIRDQLKSIPVSLQNALIKAGVKVAVVKDLAKQAASGKPGMYDPSVGIAYVPEMLPHNQKNPNPSRALRHEMGHAVDHMLNFSTSDEFMRMYIQEQDIQQQKMKEAPRFKNGMGQFVAGAGLSKTLHQAASESFAEAFAIATRSGNTAEGIEQKQFEEAFPRTIAVVKRLVEEWRQRDAKPAR